MCLSSIYRTLSCPLRSLFAIIIFIFKVDNEDSEYLTTIDDFADQISKDNAFNQGENKGMKIKANLWFPSMCLVEPLPIILQLNERGGEIFLRLFVYYSWLG